MNSYGILKSTGHAIDERVRIRSCRRRREALESRFIRKQRAPRILLFGVNESTVPGLQLLNLFNIQQAQNISVGHGFLLLSFGGADRLLTHLPGIR